MAGVSLLLGATVLAAVCLAYGWVLGQGVSDAQARSFGFAAIVFGNLAMIHATRSRDRGLLEGRRAPNRALWWVTAGALVALLASIYAPPIAEIFRFSPLSATHFAVAAAAGIVGVAWYEAYKTLRPRHSLI